MKRSYPFDSDSESEYEPTIIDNLPLVKRRRTSIPSNAHNTNNAIPTAPRKRSREEAGIESFAPDSKRMRIAPTISNALIEMLDIAQNTPLPDDDTEEEEESLEIVPFTDSEEESRISIFIAAPACTETEWHRLPLEILKMINEHWHCQQYFAPYLKVTYDIEFRMFRYFYDESVHDDLPLELDDPFPPANQHIEFDYMRFEIPICHLCWDYFFPEVDPETGGYYYVCPNCFPRPPALE